MTTPSPFLLPHRGKKQGRWTDGALVYQIYPRSFQDSNGDGIGDLNGITQRMDYLKDMGVTAIWLSPFYPSPMADFGYDVADYCDVDPMFGTIQDFKDMMAEAGKRDIKMMIDLVPNHTSDEHKWFKESSKSSAETNPFRDWYVWRDGVQSPDGSQRPLPPNNWRDALTGGPAWEWADQRQQYFLHSFDVRQPDLNWSNPAVREAVRAAMRFWLDLGVDGFRVDAVYWMAKDPLLRNDTVNPEYVEGEDLMYHALNHDNSSGWPAVYAYLSEMGDVLKEEKYQDKQRFMVTEAYPEAHNPLKEYLTFYVGMDPEVAAPFNFEGLSMPWEAQSWRKFLKAFHGALGQINPHCVPSYAFANHDKPRLATRLGSAVARSSAILLMTLPGMVFLYYGEELGMKNVHIPPEFVQDPAAKGDPKSGLGRDGERTPMQWNDEHMAGFTSAETAWLPVADDYRTENVASQSQDPNSMLILYMQLGQLRKNSGTLKHGSIRILAIDNLNVLGYVREQVSAVKTKSTKPACQKYAVFINYSAAPAIFTTDVILRELVVSTHGNGLDGLQTQVEAGTSSNRHLKLLPHQAVVYAAA